MLVVGSLFACAAALMIYDDVVSADVAFGRRVLAARASPPVIAQTAAALRVRVTHRLVHVPPVREAASRIAEHCTGE